MYAIDGEREPPESTLPHLSGYEGARPVRSETMRIASGSTTRGERSWTPSTCTSGRGSTFQSASGRRSCARWTAPSPRGGIGPRDLGGTRRAAALHIVEGLLLAGSRPGRPPRGHAQRNRAGGTVACRGTRDPRRRLHERHGRAGRVRPALRHHRARRIRAPAPARTLPPAHRQAYPRTIDAVSEELTVDGLVLRYRVDETDDGLTGEEGTFTICSFWLVSALVEIGELDAPKLCEKLLAMGSSLQSLPSKSIRQRPAPRVFPRRSRTWRRSTRSRTLSVRSGERRGDSGASRGVRLRFADEHAAIDWTFTARRSPCRPGRRPLATRWSCR